MKVEDVLDAIDDLSPDAVVEAMALRKWATHVPGDALVAFSGGEVLAYNSRNRMVYSRIVVDDAVSTWLNLIGVPLVVL